MATGGEHTVYDRATKTACTPASRASFPCAGTDLEFYTLRVLEPPVIRSTRQDSSRQY